MGGKTHNMSRNKENRGYIGGYMRVERERREKKEREKKEEERGEKEEIKDKTLQVHIQS
jgi:hypothetical protein